MFIKTFSFIIGNIITSVGLFIVISSINLNTINIKNNFYSNNKKDDNFREIIKNPKN